MSKHHGLILGSSGSLGWYRVAWSAFRTLHLWGSTFDPRYASDTGTGWEATGGEEDENRAQSTNRYELQAWVKASDHRKGILTTLQEGTENTTHFKEKWDVATADVPRRYIKELQNRGLVECFTPDRQGYRLYGLTDEGEDLAEKL